jgi:hypothetical protein
VRQYEGVKLSLNILDAFKRINQRDAESIKRSHKWTSPAVRLYMIKLVQISHSIFPFSQQKATS